MNDMKKIFKYIVAAGAAVAVLAACNLDLTPKTSIPYDEDGVLIQTASNLTSFENGILASYRALQNGANFMAEDIQLDAFNAVADFGNNYGDLHRGDETFNAGQYEVRDFWANNYAAIKNFNILIANADKVPAAIAANAKVVKGEAYFFRAASYLQLARHFGPAFNAATAENDLCVPLVLVYDQNEKPARESVKKVYAQIKADLDSAAALLANVKGAVRSQKPTIDAVEALKARYFLDVKEYASAASCAANLIESKTYKLCDAATFENEFINDKGTEPIVQLYASLSELPNAIDYYTQIGKNADYGTVYRPYFIPSKKLVESYEADDLRFKNWFDCCVKYKLFVSGGVADGVYVFTKYIGNPALTSALQNGRVAAKPLTIAEMYLIASEASFQGGKTGDAKEYLNALQTARKAKATDATFEAIKKEWFKETVGDGLRLSCLKRWGDGFATREAQSAAVEKSLVMSGAGYNQKTLASTDYHLCWPVPTYELKVNTNLKQNAGY